MPIKPIEFLIVVLGSKRVNILDLNNVYNPPSRFNDVMRFKILRRPGVGDFVVFNDFRDDDLPEIEFIEPYAISKKIFKDITLRRSSEAGFSYQPIQIFDRLDQSVLHPPAVAACKILVHTEAIYQKSPTVSKLVIDIDAGELVGRRKNIEGEPVGERLNEFHKNLWMLHVAAFDMDHEFDSKENWQEQAKKSVVRVVSFNIPQTAEIIEEPSENSKRLLKLRITWNPPKSLNKRLLKYLSESAVEDLGLTVWFENIVGQTRCPDQFLVEENPSVEYSGSIDTVTSTSSFLSATARTLSVAKSKFSTGGSKKWSFKGS
ncbi:MAG: hypothetical protein AAF212_08565 [Verrucomicrobiota bacterium]